MTNRRRPPLGRIPLVDRLLVLWRRRGWRGFLTLHNHFRPPPRQELLAETRYGTRFRLHPFHSVDRHVIAEGFYESEVLEAVRPGLARPGAVLWVVGANFGLHAITARFLHPDVRVIAFEPFPQMADRLAENCRLNGVEVELHRVALAATAGTRPFFANASTNPGMSTLRPLAGEHYELRFEVRTVTARELIEERQVPPPTAVIIDAEGSEPDVLAGFGSHLDSPALSVLVFEAPNEFLESRQPAELHQRLAQAGFTLEKLPRREDTAHGYSNFLARRDARPGVAPAHRS